MQLLRLVLIAIPLMTACGKDGKKPGKAADKEGIELATGTKPVMPPELDGVAFGQPIDQALAIHGLSGAESVGSLDGYVVGVDFQLDATGSGGEAEFFRARITFPTKDAAVVKSAFAKAWGPGKEREEYGQALTAWLNPEQQLEVKLYFPGPKAELAYTLHLELRDILLSDQVAIPPQFKGLAIGQEAGSVSAPWKGQAGLKQRSFGAYTLYAGAIDNGPIYEFVVMGLDPTTARAEIEKIWGTGTDGKSKMDAPIVVWTNPESKLTATLDHTGRLFIAPIAN